MLPTTASVGSGGGFGVSAGGGVSAVAPAEEEESARSGTPARVRASAGSSFAARRPSKTDHRMTWLATKNTVFFGAQKISPSVLATRRDRPGTSDSRAAMHATARVPPPLQHTLASWARVNHESHLKKLALTVEALTEHADRTSADLTDTHEMVAYLQSRLHALSSAVAELPFVFQESVSDLVESHEQMRAELQAVRNQQREERAASREACAELRGLIEQSANARHAGVVARLEALESARAASDGKEQAAHTAAAIESQHRRVRAVEAGLTACQVEASQSSTQLEGVETAVRSHEQALRMLSSAAQTMVSDAAERQNDFAVIGRRTGLLEEAVALERSGREKLAETLQEEGERRMRAMAQQAASAGEAVARRDAAVEAQLRDVVEASHAGFAEARRAWDRAGAEAEERAGALSFVQMAAEATAEAVDEVRQRMEREVKVLTRRIDDLRA